MKNKILIFVLIGGVSSLNAFDFRGASGTASIPANVLKKTDIVDNLVSISTTKPASANQVKILNEKKADKPNGSTVGFIATVDATGNNIEYKAPSATATPNTQAEVTAGTAVANKYVQPNTLKVELDKKEYISNKAIDLSTPNNTKYPTTKAVSTALDKKVNTTDIQVSVRATGTAVDTKVASEKAVRDLFETLKITGDYIGSAATFAGLPTTSKGGKTAINGDWAMLTDVDNGNRKGIYIYDGSGYIFSVEMTSSILALTNVQLQDITDVTEGTIKGGKALYDREQALKGTISQVVTGVEEIAKSWDAKTINVATQNIINAYKFWNKDVGSYGDGSTTINRPDERIVISPIDLKLYKAKLDVIPVNKEPSANQTEWELVKTSGEERSISVTYGTLAQTTASTLPTGETVEAFLKHPLVIGEQPRTLTTRINVDMPLADVKTALNSTGTIEFRDAVGVSKNDPSILPKGVYQITNQSTTGESWLIDSLTSHIGSQGEYFDGGYIGQTNYSAGWSQLKMISDDSTMSGFSLSNNVATCLVAGRYNVYASLSMGDIAQGQRGSGNSRLQIIIRKNGTNTKSEAWTQITSSNWQSQIATEGIVDLSVGDTIDVAIGAYGVSAYTRASKLVITPVAKQVVEKTTPIVTSYSTGEQDTNTVWIDGKPIYQKTIDQPISNGGASSSIALGIETLVDYKGGIKAADGHMITMPYNDGSSRCNMYVSNTGSLVVRNWWSASGNTTLKLTVYYTKQ